MEANPGAGPLDPAPSRMIANPQARFVEPSKPAVTTPEKGLQGSIGAHTPFATPRTSRST